MARFDSGNSHGIRLPGQVLDEIRSKEESGEYGKDSRFAFHKKKGKNLLRKDRRKEERTLKKQKRLNHQEPYKSTKSERNDRNETNRKVPDDPLAALAALKAKKQTTPKPSKIAAKRQDDAPDLDYVDDPLEALRALKAKKAQKSQEVRIVKEDDLEDSDFGGFGSEAESEGENEETNINDEDPMEALRRLKAAKAGKNNTETDVRIVKEDDLDDDLDLEDFDEDLDEDLDGEALSEDGEDDILADFEDGADDFDGESDDSTGTADLGESPNEFDDISDDETPEPTRDSKKASKKEKVIEATFVDPFENDMEFYAKKLGLKDGKRSKLSKTGDHDDIGGLLDDLDFDYLEESQDEGSDEGSHAGDDSETEDEKPKENPFVAPTSSSETSKYIPPALRRKLALELSELSPEILALRKSIKGPINKLSETNVGSIVNEINGLFLNNARQSVTENLTSIILESIVQQGRLLDTFVYLHATLVAAIYRLQGVDFGAYFVQTLIENFEKSRSDPSKSKEAVNLVSLLSSVYSFQLVSSRLLYDVIRVLIDELSESNAELLLKIIRNSGNQMRSDDPSALKEIVLLVTKKSSSLSQDNMSTRMQFLVETIASLKNNKLKDNNESTHQLIIRLKKFLGTFTSGKAHDPLQVGLDDIRNIETKGKWWLVGSAWKGDDSENKNELVNTDVMNDILDTADVNWLELARAQRMNTDIRRAIFVSIMSANDYIDAVTKLDKLALRKAQEREIPRIVIHCAVVEPAWNPYYGILAAKLCDSHSYRKTFQFMLWDLIKGFEGSQGDDSDDEDVFSGFDETQDEDDKLKKILNLGRFFGYLFAEGSVALHILRTVNFVTMSADNKLFMEVLLVTFLDQIGKKSQVNAIGVGLIGKKKMSEQKFDDRILIGRLLKAKEQPALLKGIRYFIGKRLRSSDFVTGKKQRKRIEWGIGAMGDVIDEFVKEYEF